jgi:cobalamin biosynthesis protein CobD/CbiB
MDCNIDIDILIFIYLMQLCFHPVAAVGRLVKYRKKKAQNKRNKTQNNKTHRIHKI